MALLVFSDVDGTLVHYEDVLQLVGKWSDEVNFKDGTHLFVDGRGLMHSMLKLPASTTGRQGAISTRTLELVHELRCNGTMPVGFVLISGARTSTMLQRLAYLPTCDAFVTENGGRIFFRQVEHRKTAAPYVEDLAWLHSHQDAIGSVGEASLPPEKREGPLWEVYRQLHSLGWKLDVSGYLTSFRVAATQGEDPEAQLEALIRDYGGGVIQYSSNLGLYDVYPCSSGKAQAAEYIRKERKADIFASGQRIKRTVALCDDDNDIELAMSLDHAYIPCITSEKLRLVIHHHPDHFTVSKHIGTMAAEDMLLAIAADGITGTS